MGEMELRQFSLPHIKPTTSVLITMARGEDTLCYQTFLTNQLNHDVFVASFNSASLIFERVRLFGEAPVSITFFDGQKFLGRLSTYDGPDTALIVQLLQPIPHEEVDLEPCIRPLT